MTVLVTGAKGQLGQDVIEELNKRWIKTVGTDIDDMDITDETAVFSKINRRYRLFYEKILFFSIQSSITVMTSSAMASLRIS